MPLPGDGHPEAGQNPVWQPSPSNVPSKYRLISSSQVDAVHASLAAAGIKTVVGYHATDSKYVNSIMQSGFTPSENLHDWLGDGTYFWEDDLGRAWEWAQEHFPHSSAVLGVLLRLDGCMDLLRKRREWLPTLKAAEKQVRRIYRLAKRPLPKQKGKAHFRDRLIFNQAAEWSVSQGVLIRSVRETFIEGKKVWAFSHVYEQSHVQIAMRDDSIIEAIWVAESL